MPHRAPSPFGILLLLLLCADHQAGESTVWTSSLHSPASPPLVFPRTQCHKYWRFQNYLHWWNDRPLATDRSTRPAVVDGVLVTPGSDVQAVADSLQADAALAKAYQLDGLGSFGSTWYQEPYYELYLEALAASGTTGYRHLLEVGPSIADLTYLRPALAKALASPYAARIGGKVLVSSYAIDRDGPTLIASQRQALRGEFGTGFVLVVEMTAVSEEMHRLYRLGQLSAAPSAKLDEVKAVLRQYLDAADGLMVESVHHMEAPTAGRYDNRFDLAFYRDCLIPILKAVRAEPAYAGKLLGLAAAAGYANNRTGDNNSEECTRRLRNSLEAAINAAPDFLILPEWNEQNENTSLQPTVSNSWTHRRIVEHYMRTIRGLPLAPREGDDTSLPNCILSHRKELRLGEMLELEILNVPDSTSTASYTATLSLEDAAGNVVRTFAPQSFTRNVLRDVTISVASETLAAHPVLRPVLTIAQATAPLSRTFRDGLMHIAVRPTTAIDYQTVKQPLRDIATLGTTEFQLVGTAGRDVTLSGAISAGEPLASVEIIADGDEAWAYDRLDEYDVTNNDVILGSYTTLPGGYDVDLTVTGTTGFQFKPVWMPEALIPYQRIGNVIRFSAAERGREWPGRFHLLIPKASRSTAVISLTSSHGSFTVPVADVLAHGVHSRTPEAQMVVRFESFHRLADHPVPIAAPTASFTTTLHAESDRPVYHLRVITASGRIWRSKPIEVPLVAASAAVAMTVPCESLGGAAGTVQVPRNAIPDLAYEFDSRCGDVLPVAAGPRWFAQLGGGTLYADPFYPDYAGYPASRPLSKPAWSSEDGAPCLRFSGDGQYLVLPTEAFPRGAFTLSFEIKPLAATPQVLFRHHGILIGSLMLRLKDGRLLANYVDKLVQEHAFDTGLDVPTGQWSRITVAYDLAAISFTVGTQPPRTYPFTGTALYFQPSVFGGHLRPGFGVEAGDGFFNGCLKSLRILHAASLPPSANTPPVAHNQSVTTAPGTARSLILTGSDADGDPLTVSIATSPLHGTLSGAPPALIYTPEAGFTGADSFTFTVSDGRASSGIATVSITVASRGGAGVGASSGGGSGCGAGGAAGLLLLLPLGLSRRRRLPPTSRP